MHVNSSSKLYRELTLDEISVIESRHFSQSSRIIEAQPLAGGLFNTIYLLKLSDHTKVVLRMGPVNRHLLLPFEHNLMKASAAACRLLQANAVPTANILAVDDTLQKIDREYMLMEYVPGDTLFEFKSENSGICYYEMGEYARRIHNIKGTCFGRLSQIAAGGGYDTWREAICGEAADYIACAGRNKLFSSEVLNGIEKVYSLHASVLDDITQPHLVHGDLWPANVIVQQQEENQLPRVAAIIDMDRSLFGDPDFDFPAGKVPNEMFEQGYGRNISRAPRAVLRHKLYALLYSLLSCYALCVQHGQEAQSQRHHRQVMKLLCELS